MLKKTHNQTTIDRAKLHLGNRLLDVAEMLPTFRGGTIASLQRIRQRQRERGRNAFEHARTAQGAELALSQVILIEVFPVEELDRMIGGLQRLFPDKRFFFNPLSDVRNTGRDLFSSSWRSLGMITRSQQNPFFSPFPLHTAPALPPSVKSIELELHKIFSSLFVLSFHVELERGATDKLRALQEEMYLPQICFRQWFPKSLRLIGPYSEMNPESVKARALSEWMLSLRRDIERVLRNYFSGFFFRATPQNRAALPALNVFELRGDCPAQGEDQWLASLAPLLEPLSLTQASHALDVYSNEDIRVFRPWETEKTTYQILRVQRRQSLPNEDHEYFRMKEIVRALIVASGALEFLSGIQTTVEALRLRVYQRLMSKHFINLFRKDLLLYRQVQQARLLLTRFSLEYEQQARWFTEELESLSQFYYSGEWHHKTLSKNICEGLAFKTGHMRSHLDFVNSSFLDNISARNTELMYRLQFQMLIWTVFVALATSIVVIGPDIVKSWFRLLWLKL